MLRKIVCDWSLWLLILFNLYLLNYYQENPDTFRTLVFLYWVQSALIGVANFLYLATIRHIKPGSFEVNGQPAQQKDYSRGCMSVFFLFHYGCFHLCYLIFLIIKTTGNIDYNVFRIGVSVICINVAVDFIRQKIRDNNRQVDMGKAFVLPYARIVPMHMMILLPEFFKVSNLTVFIVLKIIMDIVMHIATTTYNKKPEADLPSVT